MCARARALRSVYKVVSKVNLQLDAISQNHRMYYLPCESESDSERNLSFFSQILENTHIHTQICFIPPFFRFITFDCFLIRRSFIMCVRVRMCARHQLDLRWYSSIGAYIILYVYDNISSLSFSIVCVPVCMAWFAIVFRHLTISNIAIDSLSLFRSFAIHIASSKPWCVLP